MIKHFISEIDIQVMEWKQAGEQTEGSASLHTGWERRDWVERQKTPGFSLWWALCFFTPQ